LGKCSAFVAWFMRDGFGKIKQAKKSFAQLGKKQVLRGLGENH